MVFILPRKALSIGSLCSRHLLLRTFNFCSVKSLTTIPDMEHADASQHSNTLHLSSLFPDVSHPSTGYDVELVDHDAWGVSFGVAQAWRARGLGASGATFVGHEVIDEARDSCPSKVGGDLDFEDIDNMRVRGDLFYKLERSSKEFEEYSLELHRKKSSKKNDDKKEKVKDLNKMEPSLNVASTEEKHPRVPQVTRSESVTSRLDEINDTHSVNKRQRIPTFNLLTGPYHEPFCLDIYISKASVRACIVHRVTSKVVAVAHSISKDIKFDLACTRNKTSCAAVGTILAQRALADDIHDVIYTPRKGERLEGKLQIVLHSVIDNGINVKVKIKQRPKQPFRLIRPRA